jgi:hypothetical protein
VRLRRQWPGNNEVMAGQCRGNVGLEGCSRGDDVEKVLGGEGETMERLVGWERVWGN